MLSRSVLRSLSHDNKRLQVDKNIAGDRIEMNKGSYLTFSKRHWHWTIKANLGQYNESTNDIISSCAKKTASGFYLTVPRMQHTVSFVLVFFPSILRTMMAHSFRLVTVMVVVLRVPTGQSNFTTNYTQERKSGE